MGKVVLLALVLVAACPPPTNAAPPVRAQTWQHAAAEWNAGTLAETHVADGALRLLPGHYAGSYTAPPLPADAPFTALFAHWRAHVDPSQRLLIEVHTSADGQTWNPWQALVPLQDGEQTRSLLTAWGPPQRWLQYRVRMTALFGAPALDAITLTVVDAPGERAANSLPQPLLPAAALPLDAPPAPQAIPYAAWADGTSSPASASYQPRRIEIVPAAVTNAAAPFAVLRALRWASQAQLNDVLHAVVDERGQLFNGALPLSKRLPDSDAGVVRIGVFLDGNGAMSTATRAQLRDLLRWLIRTYQLRIENIGAAAGTPAPFGEAVSQARADADAQMVRWRRAFMGGGGTLMLYNPTSDAARATITARTTNGVEQRVMTLPAAQRTDVALDALFANSAVQSIDVEASRVLHAEYVTHSDTGVVGSTGTTDGARSWYFAGASTVSDTDTLLRIFNPAAEAVTAQVVMYSDGAVPVTHTATLAPHQHSTISLHDLVADQQFGVHLITAAPVLADQMVQSGSGTRAASSGTTALQRRWSFAEGLTTADYTTTLHVLNPWPQPVALTLQIMSEDGTSLTRRYAMPPQAQINLRLNDIVPDLAFAFDVMAERPVAAERELMNATGSATATMGAAAPATRWTFAAGTTANAEQYLLVANAQPTATELEVRYLLADGTTTTHRATVPPSARLTLHANDDVPAAARVATLVTASQPVVAERTLVVPTANGAQLYTSVGDGGR